MSRALIAIALALSTCGCRQPPPAPARTPAGDTATSRPGAAFERLAPGAAGGLKNVFRLPGGVFSGPGPHAPYDFEALARLGVRTIISVDAAPPDVDAARAAGLRYVHLPIGYDGVDPGRRLELARAVRDLPRPVYLHCHHGVHRGPAAAACALVTLDWLDPVEAEQFLRQAGTSPHYAGLYQAVRTARPASPAELHAAPAEFPERAAVNDLAAGMAAIDETIDRLKAIQAAGWGPPPDHPDLVPSAEATLLAEGFRELSRLEESATRPPEFREQLRAAEKQAWALVRAIDTGDRSAAADHLAGLIRRCTACHRQFRD